MENQVRQQLKAFLQGHQAHMTLDDALKKFPQKDINLKAAHVEYSFWELLEHIRRTQADILEFIKSSKYKEKSWPDDYWPKKGSKATKKDWDKTINSIRKDLAEAVQLSQSKKIQLEEEISWGDGQTYLREFMLIVDHNAYHLGEFAILRQVVGNW